MKPLKTHYPNATLAILDTEPYGSEYPCELVVHWPTCGIEAVVCGYVEADIDGNFDLNTFTYGQSLSDSRLSDTDDWRADWGMAMTVPDGVDYTADEVGEVMTKIMRRLKTARIEYT
nr:MAG TPA: hypothetical protein [Bacteriophage sp.]